MRRPPPLVDLIRYPVTGGTGLLAIGFTLAGWGWFGKVDISALTEGFPIRQGQLWRIVTSALPHVDVLHLAFNLYWVWAFGTLIEETWGHLRTAVLFVVLAVAANGAEYAFLVGGEGLSGVGYGLFGLLWVLTRRGDRRFVNEVDNRTAGLFVAWFFFCVIATELDWMPIANIAHGVGAITGGLIGWTISTSGYKRWIGSAATAMLVVAVLAGDTVARPWVNFDKNRGVDEAYQGYVDLAADRNQEALRWCRDSVRARPDNGGYWYNLGIAWHRTGHESESIEAFQRAAVLTPGDPKIADAARDSRNFNRVRSPAPAADKNRQ
jgi:membrane associated rhomboid family serine protease